jgi:hypothetical protein
MLKDKIKSILSLRGIKMSDYASSLNIQNGSLSKKFKDSIFSYQDLCVLAKITNTSLCLVDKNTKEVLYNLSDN